MINAKKIIGNQKPKSIKECLAIMFAAGVRRHQTLDLSDCPKEYLSSMTAAARTYKRGLPVHPKVASRPRMPPEICFENLRLPPQATAIVDVNVYHHWQKKLDSSTTILIKNVDEKHKNMESFLSVCERLKDYPKHVYIIGGGIVTDLGAFCCAYLNIDYTLVPTTLLAMIDAAIGGKCGINFEPYGKNQVGLFATAAKIVIDVEFLTTLNPREFRSGLAEAYKHYFIDPKKLSIAEFPKNAAKCTKKHLHDFMEVKKKIVTVDPEENGLRKTLNFGHTFGHALESLLLESARPLLHGEAVAWGMVFANFVSVEMQQQSCLDFDKSVKELKSLSLLTNLHAMLRHWDREKLLYYMQHDKKNDEHIQMVLYSKAGHLVENKFTHKVETIKMHAYLEKFLDYLKNNQEGLA